MNPKTKNILVWVAQGLMAAGFLFFGYSKVTSNPEIVANFERWGYPYGVHLLIGVIEIIGGLLLLIPKAAGYAAIVLIGNMVGAIATHLMNSEAAYIGLPLIFMVLLVVVLWGRMPEPIKKLLPGS